MGDTLLRHPRFKEDQKLRDTVATCVCLTACGNFVLVGYATGHVDKFNIQSGLHRGELRDDRVLNETGQLDIRGICSDGLNQVMHVLDLAASHFTFLLFILNLEFGWFNLSNVTILRL